MGVDFGGGAFPSRSVVPRFLAASFSRDSGIFRHASDKVGVGGKTVIRG
jgi:hypothetical protein